MDATLVFVVVAAVVSFLFVSIGWFWLCHCWLLFFCFVAF